MNISADSLLFLPLLFFVFSSCQDTWAIIKEYWGKKEAYSILVCGFIQVSFILSLWGMMIDRPSPSLPLFALVLFFFVGSLLASSAQYSLQMRIIRNLSPSGMYLKTSSLFANHRNDEALAQAELTLQNPKLENESRSLIHMIRSICFFRLKRIPDSLDAINLAIEINPTQDEFLLHRGNIYFREGRYSEAMVDYETALKCAQSGVGHTNLRGVQNTIAWGLATCPEAKFRNGTRALELAMLASKGSNSGPVADTLAAAYAEVGQLKEAIALAEEIVNQCPKEYTQTYQERLDLYRQGMPYRILLGKFEMVKSWNLKP